MYEWLRKARVCTLLVGTESVTQSRSDIALLWQNDGLSILREQTLALYGALHAVNDTEHHHIMIISPFQTFNFGLNLASCIHKSKKKKRFNKGIPRNSEKMKAMNRVVRTELIKK